MSFRPGQVQGIVFFTIVEVLTLSVWLILGPTIVSSIVLLFGLLAEHSIATLVGNLPPRPSQAGLHNTTLLLSHSNIPAPTPPHVMVKIGALLMTVSIFLSNAVLATDPALGVCTVANPAVIAFVLSGAIGAVGGYLVYRGH